MHFLLRFILQLMSHFQVLAYADIVFTSVFTAEIVLKVITSTTDNFVNNERWSIKETWRGVENIMNLEVPGTVKNTEKYDNNHIWIPKSGMESHQAQCQNVPGVQNWWDQWPLSNFVPPSLHSFAQATPLKELGLHFDLNYVRRGWKWEGEIAHRQREINKSIKELKTPFFSSSYSKSPSRYV